MDSASVPGGDRYVTFCNIDCDGMAARMLPLARARIESGGFLDNPFWRRFYDRTLALEAGEDIGMDALYLICSHIMYLAEIFDDVPEADEGRKLLEDIEMQCA